ncbi:MAG: SIS domain-containing protein [Oligoflexia bacterium]|nr:SIS domain-containing protein [Oligoflexia bacterium]
MPKFDNIDLYKQYIKNELHISLNSKSEFVSENIDKIVEAASLMANVSLKGGKIIYFGNGGSAADSQHLAAEHVNKLRVKRPALPAIALTTDTSIITSIANDMDFNKIFTRQIEALANDRDIAVGISTSGNSPNVVDALVKARDMNLKTIAFTGGNGGTILARNMADIIFNVSMAQTSSRIQETQIFLGHIIIELMDKILFE